MNRKELEENIGRNVKIRLFDGKIIKGYLRKTGEEDYRNNPNLYIPKNFYFLTDGKSNECRTCLFKVSHIRTLKVLEGQDKVRNNSPAVAVAHGIKCGKYRSLQSRTP